MHTGGIAHAHISLTAFSKGVARNAGHLLGDQKLLTELLGGKPRGADTGEHVKSASGLKAVKAQFPEPLHQQPEAAVILFIYGLNVPAAYLLVVGADMMAY